MTPPKALCEATLRVINVLRDLALHERAAVIGMAGTLLQAEARSVELAQLETQMPPPTSVTDEHYRA